MGISKSYKNETYGSFDVLATQYVFIAGHNSEPQFPLYTQVPKKVMEHINQGGNCRLRCQRAILCNGEDHTKDLMSITTTPISTLEEFDEHLRVTTRNGDVYICLKANTQHEICVNDVTYIVQVDGKGNPKITTVESK